MKRVFLMVSLSLMTGCGMSPAFADDTVQNVRVTANVAVVSTGTPIGSVVVSSITNAAPQTVNVNNAVSVSSITSASPQTVQGTVVVSTTGAVPQTVNLPGVVISTGQIAAYGRTQTGFVAVPITTTGDAGPNQGFAIFFQNSLDSTMQPWSGNGIPSVSVSGNVGMIQRGTYVMSIASGTVNITSGTVVVSSGAGVTPYVVFVDSRTGTLPWAVNVNTITGVLTVSVSTTGPVPQNVTIGNSPSVFVSSGGGQAPFSVNVSTTGATPQTVVFSSNGVTQVGQWTVGISTTGTSPQTVNLNGNSVAINGAVTLGASTGTLVQVSSGTSSSFQNTGDANLKASAAVLTGLFVTTAGGATSAVSLFDSATVNHGATPVLRANAGALQSLSQLNINLTNGLTISTTGVTTNPDITVTFR